jgi:adenylate cyclase
MADERVNRKMSAILSADVKSYSRLMSADEEGTVRALNECREIIARCVDDHRGRVVDSPGDNVLAEFVSTVEAVKCAVKIQEDLKVRNADLPESRWMEFRIGVNLGDVIEEEKRIYGDGVNIAARLEGLAEAGGICISRTAYDQVKNKLEVGYEYLGEHSVKNIAEPVPVYRVLMQPEAAGKVIGEKRKEKRRMALAAIIVLLIGFAGLAGWYLYLEQSKRIEPASVDKMAYALPDKPSIAVLPFDNLSEDPNQEYFSDGLTEEIITALSKIDRMFVIARNSTFTYKGKPVKIKQVAEDLGVRYVLEGSVRKAQDRVRISAQLIDALEGHHLWAERYDRELKDIFALQDALTMEIMSALQVKLTDGEQARLYAKGTDNIEAFLKCLQGREYMYRFNREGIDLARPLLEEAITLDPNYAAPYRWLGGSHMLDVILGDSKNPKESLMTAIKLAQKAISLDASFVPAYCLLARLYAFIGQYDKAVEEAERAVAIDPNSADVYDYLGFVLVQADRAQEAIPLIKKGIRLNPIPPKNYLYHLASAYGHTGQYSEAIPILKELLQQDANDFITHLYLTLFYSLSGQEEKARAEAAELLRINPQFRAEKLRTMSASKNKARVQKSIDALRKLGLP